MLARHCTLARVQQSRYKTLKHCDFLWRTSSMFFLVWREWSVCFRSPATSLVDGFSSFRKMPSASHIVGRLNRHVHHPAWKPPSLDALRFAEIQTANAHCRQSPIQISCGASWTWLRKETEGTGRTGWWFQIYGCMKVGSTRNLPHSMAIKYRTVLSTIGWHGVPYFQTNPYPKKYCTIWKSWQCSITTFGT